MSSPVRVLPIPTSSGVIVDTSEQTNPNVTYMGFTLAETAGGTAKVRVRQASASGTILDTIPMAAGEGVADYYPQGIRCDGDLYIEIVSGTVEGSVLVA